MYQKKSAATFKIIATRPDSSCYVNRPYNSGLHKRRFHSFLSETRFLRGNNKLFGLIENVSKILFYFYKGYGGELYLFYSTV